MIDVTSIDARPGEAEIVSLMAGYVAARLFTPRQRRSLSVIIDLTSQPVRVPVTRTMLGLQKSGLGVRPPRQFEMTVSTAAGIRDAAEVVAHELLHVAQAVNGRLLIASQKRRINGVKRVVETARWMSGKPVIIDELAWQHRPWEIEACHWQGTLVTEFLMLTTGQYAEQPVQAPKKKQLALYPVDVPAPAMAAMPQEPAFAPASAMAAGPAGAPPVAIEPGAETAMAATADPHPDAALPQATPAFDGDVDVMPVMPLIEEPDDALMADLAADLAFAAQPGGSFGGPADHATPGMPADQNASDVRQNGPSHHNGNDMGNGTGNDMGNGMGNGTGNGTGNGSGHRWDEENAAAPQTAPDAAIRSMPVYDKDDGAHPGLGTENAFGFEAPAAPVIEVEVPGLDSPRPLDPLAMSRKLDELRDRGLVGV